MINGISKKYHGIADAGYIPAVWMAPHLLHFEEEKTAVAICRISGAADLAYSLFTNAPWGAKKLISYKAHALIDIAQGALALAAAAALPIKNKRAQRTLIAMGITGLLVGGLSYIGSRKEV